MILSAVVSAFPLFQNCTKGKYKVLLLLRCDSAFCSSAVRIRQTLTPLKKSSSLLILPPAVLLLIFLSFRCCPGLVCMDGVKYGINI